MLFTLTWREPKDTAVSFPSLNIPSLIMRKNTQEILTATHSTKIPDCKTISFIKNRKKIKEKENVSKMWVAGTIKRA